MDASSAPVGLAPALTAFFEPRAVAVIGASRDPTKIGGSVLANLVAAGFPGRIVPVNARAGSVQGLAAVPSILDAEEPIDLAVLAVPASEVLPVLRQCAAKGVRGAVVISAGFSETGATGAERESAMRDWLRHERIRVLGPNCLGWIRPARRLNVTFAPGMPLAGSIAFVSHSGALAVAILDWSRERRMGFSLFASLGNQADLTETDVIAAVADDVESRVIVAYLEGVAHGRRFFETLGRTAAVKPVIVLKAGRSEEGARAVASHTGALAGSDEAFDAAVKQAGAVRARSIEELFDLARAVSAQPVPRGRRVAIVTNGGGLGIVATDAARDAGLTVAPLDDDIRQRLRAVLPQTASVTNPVDLVGDADAARFGNALRIVGDAKDIDAALVLLTAQAATDSTTVARAIIGATRPWTFPIIAAFVGGARVAPGARVLEESSIPCYAFPEDAVVALRGMARIGEGRRRPAEIPPSGPERQSARAGLRRLAAPGGAVLGMLELAPLLAAYGIRGAGGRLATTPEEAGRLAPSIGFPLALKLVSPDVTHKSDVGGVRLGLASSSDVAAAAAAMLARVGRERPGARVSGFLLQPMVQAGREMLVGFVRDRQFGPLIVVGFGGVYVEVLKDTTTRLAPIAPSEALTMLTELRLAPLLAGVRGEPGVDREALADAISRFSRLAADLDELAEMELNPLMAAPWGAIAVDARASVATAGVV